MKYLVETPWETRNLGIKSFSVQHDFFSAPDFQGLALEMNQTIKQHDKIFIFVRIAKPFLSYALELQNLGFALIECTVCPYSNFSKNEILAKFCQDRASFLPQKYLGRVEFIALQRDNQFPLMRLREIASESFVDDRFHVDSRCPQGLADRRCRFWIDDLVADHEVEFDVLLVDKTIAGFMARKKNSLILAGFARQFVRAGLGVFLWLSSCEWMAKIGFTSSETLISINNLPVLNLYTRLNFKFRDTQYSFHYWS